LVDVFPSPPFHCSKGEGRGNEDKRRQKMKKRRVRTQIVSFPVLCVFLFKDLDLFLRRSGGGG